MKYSVAEFKIRCEAEVFRTSCDLIADIAGEAGFESFEDTEEGINGYIQKDVFNRDVLDECLSYFPIQGVNIEYNISDVEDKDWNEQWEDIGFDTINIDDKILIYDAKHCERPIDNLNKTIKFIGIEAIQAFGTGTHQTTRMIISSLLKMQIHGLRVLDCGCGTGILGITASKLGASSIVGYDIDEWSVNNAMHNATINDIDNIDILHGDVSVLSHVCGVFNIVLANINRNILLNDMHVFCDVMCKDATLIISGFYEEDIATLLNKASVLGLKEISRLVDDNWACLLLRN
mgnify:FL=1